METRGSVNGQTLSGSWRMLLSLLMGAQMAQPPGMLLSFLLAQATLLLS